MVFILDKFKAYQNQSLAIFDNESLVHEEEGIEEGVRRVQTQSITTNQSRGQIKDIRIENLYQYIQDKNE